jgi:hypothetical protein
MLLSGALPRKLHRLESARDRLPHAANHHHLAQGARELVAEEVSLRFLGLADPRVALLSGFVPHSNCAIGEFKIPQLLLPPPQCSVLL